MAKRKHFLEADFDTFFYDQNWITNLKKKVDYQTTTKIKVSSYSIINMTFLAGLMSRIPFDSPDAKETIDYIFYNLDDVNYQYSEKDLDSHILYATVNDLWTDNLIYLFDCLEKKGINLKKHNNKLYNTYGGIHNVKLDKYRLENGLMKRDYISHMLNRYLDIIDDYNKYDHLGIYKMIDKKEREEYILNYKEANTFLTEIIETNYVTKKHLKELLYKVSYYNKLLKKYITNNELNVNIFQYGNYFNTLEFKPKEVFTKGNLDFIEILEKKLNIKYLDDSGKTPQTIFQETCDKKGLDFSGGIVLEYRDGTNTIFPGAFLSKKNKI